MGLFNEHKKGVDCQPPKPDKSVRRDTKQRLPMMRTHTHALVQNPVLLAALQSTQAAALKGAVHTAHIHMFKKAGMSAMEWNKTSFFQEAF